MSRPTPDSSYYPPRSSRLWAGRRARHLLRAQRGWARLRAWGWLGILALVPGLPLAVARRWVPASALLLAWGACLSRYIYLRAEDVHRSVRFWLPGLGGFQYEPMHLWYGLAAGIHIASIVALLHPHLRGFSREGRFAVAILVMLIVYGFGYASLLSP